MAYKNNQKIIQEAQNDYSTFSCLERPARKLEFQNSEVQSTLIENS